MRTRGLGGVAATHQRCGCPAQKGSWKAPPTRPGHPVPLGSPPLVNQRGTTYEGGTFSVRHGTFGVSDGWSLSAVQTVQVTATSGTDTTAPITPATTVPEATVRATASGCRLTARLI